MQHLILNVCFRRPPILTRFTAMTPIRSLLCIAVVFASLTLQAQESKPGYRTETDLSYRDDGGDEYIRERCKLDIYVPTNVDGFSTVVWFHGGGLTGGNKSIPKGLQNQGIGVVAVNYRLSPKVKVEDCLEDAVCAVSWTMDNINEYGGSAQRVFVSGHSAGGYLTSMIGLDKNLMAMEGIDTNDIAGLIPFSGHTITHFTARKELGLADTQPLINELAPLYHVRPDAPPLLLITGDRELEMLGRYEENAYLWRMMKVAGHTRTTLYELDGFNHGQMAEPAFPLLVRFVKEISAEKDKAATK